MWEKGVVVGMRGMCILGKGVVFGEGGGFGGELRVLFFVVF